MTDMLPRPDRKGCLARLDEHRMHPAWKVFYDWFAAEIEAARDRLEKADPATFALRQGEIRALRRLQRLMTSER